MMAILGVVLFAASGAAIVVIRRTLRERLVERASFEVQRALFQREIPAGEEDRLVGECSVGTLAMGTSGPGFAHPPELDEGTWREIVARTSSVEMTFTEDRGVSGVTGARKLSDGRVRWAKVMVSEPAEFRVWRFVAIALTTILVALLVVAARAGLLMRRASHVLGESVRALKFDLSAPVPSTGMLELEEVATRLRALARDLGTAQHERAQLLAALAQEERLATVGRLTAGLAHEIRNPLAAIKLRVDLLGESSAGGAQDASDIRSDLAVVGSEVERLDRLLADLLLLTRPTARARVEKDIGKLASARALFVSPLAASRHVDIRVVGNATFPLDIDAVTRALDNLLVNAIDASPEHGSVEVEVGRRGDTLEIAVADEGPGIAPESVGKVFEPFFTTKARGTGLGLALARAVARAHGGSLDYQRDGQCTRFVMRLRNAAS